MTETSKGHIGWSRSEYGTFEYFERDGFVLRAPEHNAIMTDGYRCGRFECSTAMWRHFHRAEVLGLEESRA